CLRVEELDRSRHVRLRRHERRFIELRDLDLDGEIPSVGNDIREEVLLLEVLLEEGRHLRLLDIGIVDARIDIDGDRCGLIGAEVCGDGRFFHDRSGLGTSGESDEKSKSKSFHQSAPMAANESSRILTASSMSDLPMLSAGAMRSTLL